MAKFSKTTFSNGSSPAINAANLNNIGTGIQKNDILNYFNLATVETRNLNIDTDSTFKKDDLEIIKVEVPSDIASGTQITVEIDDDGTTYNLYKDYDGDKSVTKLDAGVYQLAFKDATTDFFFLATSGGDFDLWDTVPTSYSNAATSTMLGELSISNEGFFLGLVARNSSSYTARCSMMIDGAYIVGSSSTYATCYCGINKKIKFNTSLGVIRQSGGSDTLRPVVAYKLGSDYEDAETHIYNPIVATSGATNVIVDIAGSGRLSSISNYYNNLLRIVVDGTDKFYGYLSGNLELDMEYTTSLKVYSSVALSNTSAPLVLVAED